MDNDLSSLRESKLNL
ncbi:hypothetical protein CP8484711_0709A, partial [Chlamydia psittaci 84-8471/1]